MSAEAQHDYILEIIPECEPEQTIFYDRRLNKVSLRIVIGGKECRVVFQGLKNRDASGMEKILDTLGKEAPHKVFLPLTPFEHDDED